jgi:transcriptional regulator with XRE-family HTH domain
MKRLRELLAERGSSIVAQEVGLDPSTTSRIHTGRAKPTLRVLARMAVIYGDAFDLEGSIAEEEPDDYEDAKRILFERREEALQELQEIERAVSRVS